jgi:hypothetical protein
MSRLFKTFTGKFRKYTMFSLAACAGVAALSRNARADDRYIRDYRYGDEHRYERRDRSDLRIGIDVNVGRPAPRYVERRVRIWVEPVYRTECRKVWVEPVYRTEYEEVVVRPARYLVHEIIRYEDGRRCVSTERTLVEPAVVRRVPHDVLVTAGHWDTLERRVCVSEGHWDYRVERVPCDDRFEETRFSLRF